MLITLKLVTTMKKTISFVGSVGIPARYGGFETLVEELSNRLKKHYSIRVFCSKGAYSESERTTKEDSVIYYYIPLKANGIQSILYDIFSFRKALTNSDVIILLGGGAGIFLALIQLFSRKKKILFHPDGLEWKRDKWCWITNIYLRYSIRLLCRLADKIIIDNKALRPYYNRFSAKLEFCTYGGDQYELSDNPTANEGYWLTIARAEPENKLEIIAQSFLGNKTEQWKLISNYLQTSYGRKLYERFGNAKNIQFVAADYSKTFIENQLNGCRGYIHGHSAGGTNPTLTAAMWLNKPILCHRNEFNLTTTREAALFFSSAEELCTQREKNPLPNTAITQKAKKIAIKEYQWNQISEKYRNILERLLKK